MRQPHIRTVYPTWAVYPRVQYFRNRLLSLYPRFKRTVGSVQWKIQDHLEAIYNLFEADIEVLIIANSELRTQRFIVDQTSLPESTEECHGQKGHKTRVCLCYIEGDVREPQFTESLHDVLEAFNNSPASEECFLFVAVKKSENPSPEQRTQLQYEVDKRLKRRPPRWDMSSSVLFEVVGTEIPLAISDYFEKLLYESFSVVAECLKLFIQSEPLDNMKTTHFDFEKFLSTDNTIDRVGAGIYAMERESLMPLVTHGIKENIGCEGVLRLARIIKCLVLFTTYEKLSMSSYVMQAILVEAHFEEEFTKQITSSSIDLLLEIKGIREETKISEQQIHMGFKQKMENLLRSVMKDISSLVQNLEKEYARRASICTKMSFEVNSYLKQSNFGVKMPEGPVISTIVRQEILRIKGVYCIGTVYNQFTVYLEPDNADEQEKTVRSKINEVMKTILASFRGS